MGIMDFTAQSNRNSNRSNQGTNNADRPASQIWLNVGYEANGKFISLPLGMAIDTMREATISGQNEDFIKQRTAQNDLLKMLQKAGASFVPGQEETLTLVVKLRRVNETLEISKADNEYGFNFGSLIAPTAPKELENA